MQHKDVSFTLRIKLNKRTTYIQPIASLIREIILVLTESYALRKPL